MSSVTDLMCNHGFSQKNAEFYLANRELFKNMDFNHINWLITTKYDGEATNTRGRRHL